MFVTGALLVLCTALLSALLIWRRRHFSYFEKLGIPGPKPNLIWGNIREYHSTYIYQSITKWLDKYGDVFGFYNGDVPFVVLRDLDFIEHVFVRNFHNFVARGITMKTDQMHPILNKSIMHIGGSEWKSIRTSVAHGMTDTKLKQMMPHIEEDAGLFMKYLEQYADSGKEVDMLEKFEELSMDYIARASFGIDERFLGKPHHPLTELARQVFRGIMKGFFHMAAQCTTTMGPFMKPLCWLSRMLEEYSFDNLNLQTAKVVQLRKNDPTLRKPDILQNLMDAEYIEDEKEGGDKEAVNGGSKRRALTTEEVITSASVIFAAGLAKHPDVQEKLRKEIIDTVGTSGPLDYEIVMKRLKYLHYVVDEALRLYPPGLTMNAFGTLPENALLEIVFKAVPEHFPLNKAFVVVLPILEHKGHKLGIFLQRNMVENGQFVTRQAKEDFEYNGIKFRAGTCFMTALYQTQTDPRYWDKPLEFNPERFAPENQTPQTKAAHIPFGVGPRNCVGKRLALLEIRYTIAKLMQKYRFELGPSQMGSLELNQYGMVSTPSRGPWILIHSFAEEHS